MPVFTLEEVQDLKKLFTLEKGDTIRTPRANYTITRVWIQNVGDGRPEPMLDYTVQDLMTRKFAKRQSSCQFLLTVLKKQLSS